MSLNSSRFPDDWCYLSGFLNVTKSSPAYHQTLFAACVVSALLAPLTVAANALILAAIWKNSSLRTPSYVLLDRWSGSY